NGDVASAIKALVFVPQSESMSQFVGDRACGAFIGESDRLGSSQHSDVRLAGGGDGHVLEQDKIRLARAWQNLKLGTRAPLGDPIQNWLRIRDAAVDRIVDDAARPGLGAAGSEHLMQ